METEQASETEHEKALLKALKPLRKRLNTIPPEHTQKSWWESIAKDTKIPFGTIKKIANGETDDPRIKTCVVLAKYLDVLLQAA